MSQISDERAARWLNFKTSVDLKRLADVLAQWSTDAQVFKPVVVPIFQGQPLLLGVPSRTVMSGSSRLLREWPTTAVYRAAGMAVRGLMRSLDSGAFLDVTVTDGTLFSAVHVLQMQSAKSWPLWEPLAEAFDCGLWFFVTCNNHIEAFTVPSLIMTNDQGQLHNETGPAFGWYGLRDYYLNGVHMLENQVLNRPTIEMIGSENNAERRRILIARYGLPRYVQDSGAKEVGRDEFGVLYRKEQTFVDEAILMVKVTNATPEPDGTFKDYWLRVDPNAYGGKAGEVPQAAVASTWRAPDGRTMLFKDYRDYRPKYES